MAEKLKDERASFRKIEESEAEPLRRQRQIMPSKKRVQNKISGELVIYFWRFFFTFFMWFLLLLLEACTNNQKSAKHFIDKNGPRELW